VNNNIIAVMGGMVLLVFVVIVIMTLAVPTVSSATQFLEDRGYEVIPATFATDITAIKAKTDNLPWYPANEITSLNIAGNQTTIISKTNLIPASGIAEQATLLSVFGNTTLIKAKTDLITSDPATQTLLTSVGKDAEYAEEHLHHKVAWYGIATPQTATVWANNTSMTPFRAISGHHTWGADVNDEAQLFGTGDTLTELGAGLVVGDFDLILITANSSSTISKIRIIWGTGTMADAIIAGQWSETMYIRSTSDTTRTIRTFTTPLISINDKIWIQHWNDTDNSTIDFFVGVHGYNF
jgi:hypothetical protein